MLMIKDLADLKKYLETRKKMAQKQADLPDANPVAKHNARGIVFGFEESIRAVDALINRPKPEGGGEADGTEV